MPLVRIKHKGHSRMEGGKVVNYAVGDTFNATPAEMAAFKDRLELVGTFIPQAPPVDNFVGEDETLESDEDQVSEELQAPKPELKKLDLTYTSEQADFVAGATGKEVLDAVKKGTLFVGSAIGAETVGRQRKGLIFELQKLVT